MMVKIGDIIDYGFFINLKVIKEDELHYTLEDKDGNTKKVYKELVDKHSTVKTSKGNNDERKGTI